MTSHRLRLRVLLGIVAVVVGIVVVAELRREKPKPVVQTRNPPLSASAKPRQLQQLTVPRASNRS